MTETNGKAKIKTVISHLESAEVLLGGLPKYMIENGKKQKVRELINKLSDFQQELTAIFKDELNQ